MSVRRPADGQGSRPPADLPAVKCLRCSGISPFVLLELLTPLSRRPPGFATRNETSADRFSGHFDLVKDILSALGQGDVDAGNLLNMKRRPIDQWQEGRRHPRFEELAGDQRQGHRMAENAVVGMWDFLLGHAPDNGRTDCHKQEQPTIRSIAGPSMGGEEAAMVLYVLIVREDLKNVVS